MVLLPCRTLLRLCGPVVCAPAFAGRRFPIPDCHSTTVAAGTGEGLSFFSLSCLDVSQVLLLCVNLLLHSAIRRALFGREANEAVGCSVDLWPMGGTCAAWLLSHCSWAGKKTFFPTLFFLLTPCFPSHTMFSFKIEQHYSAYKFKMFPDNSHGFFLMQGSGISKGDWPFYGVFLTARNSVCALFLLLDLVCCAIARW